ncbi:squalene/phytoene synthase family protein [Hyphomicrobium sp. D-2]|uniref:squalene/phytoene synthase family protein n=1 Tax=Hyphomicrobium sp. D-2 TaxID=3041621 RepID=UPI00245765E0|nr:squalene/phytoene synthase family protein [Hyphomicrobium sp. D-2]MDH4982847.1 squalene/phytoene synthase family protein [Hyphomicrobium sp. D-2]
MDDKDRSSGAGVVRDEARVLDYDRYLAALLAPVSARHNLITLAAFHGEIARIPQQVREPTMAEIRLQWWRDVLDEIATEVTAPVRAESGEDEAAIGMPLADAVRRAVGAGGMDVALLGSIVDTYDHLIYGGDLAASGAVSAFAAGSQGAAFSLGVAALGEDAGAPECDALIAAAGQAYGRVQLLRALPVLCALGRNPFGTNDLDAVVTELRTEALAWLAEARAGFKDAPRGVLPAMLPLALVEPYLKAFERLGDRCVTTEANVSPLTRVWRIYWAYRRGRF